MSLAYRVVIPCWEALPTSALEFAARLVKVDLTPYQGLKLKKPAKYRRGLVRTLQQLLQAGTSLTFTNCPKLDGLGSLTAKQAGLLQGGNCCKRKASLVSHKRTAGSSIPPRAIKLVDLPFVTDLRRLELGDTITNPIISYHYLANWLGQDYQLEADLTEKDLHRALLIVRYLTSQQIYGSLDLATKNQQIQAFKQLLAEPVALSFQVRPELEGRNYEEKDIILEVATCYGLDISHSRVPLAEAKLIQLSNGWLFTPYDYQLHGYLEYLRLDTYFNPYLPLTSYRQEDLRSLATSHQLETTELRTIYEQLQEAYFLECIQPGKYCLTEDTCPISYESIEELSDQVVLSWGVMPQLKPITWSEIASTFREVNRLANPFNTAQSLPVRLVKRLKGLALRSREASATEVLDLIESITAQQLIQDQRVRQLFLNLGQRKTSFQLLFRELFCLAMEMRGWSGYSRTDTRTPKQSGQSISNLPASEFPPGPYPIEVAVFPPEEFRNIESRINEHIIQLSQLAAKLPGGADFLSLPLMDYKYGQFIKVTHPEVGLTIADKIQIVMQGDSTHNINSCIRMSSNYLAYTSKYYGQLLGLKVPFAAADLARIA